MWYLLVIALTACAGWHLIRSRAFSENYAFGSRTNYAPSVKWMLTAIVAAAITGIMLYLLYVELLPKFPVFFS